MNSQKLDGFRKNDELTNLKILTLSDNSISALPPELKGCTSLTSFNIRGEPIVNTPTDAFNCFMGTELDYLVIGDCILDKNKQDQNLKKDYTKEFELD